MARKPMVTRTITTTKCNVLCMDIEHETPVTVEVVIPRTYKTSADMLKAVKGAMEDSAIVPVRVMSSEIEESLYGMSEQEFIEHANLLPPRGVVENCPDCVIETED